MFSEKNKAWKGLFSGLYFALINWHYRDSITKGLNYKLISVIVNFKNTLPQNSELNKSFSVNVPLSHCRTNEYGEIEAVSKRQEQKCFTTEEIQLLITGYKSGKTTYQLADEFGCHRATVSRVLKRNNVNVTNGFRKKQLNPNDVVAMYENKHTSAQIAEKYDVHPNIVLNCLRSQGVKIRSRWEY